MEAYKAKVVVLGACGRMGHELIEASYDNPGVSVVATVEHPDHPRVGALIGNAGEFVVASNLREALFGADVLIDFTSPEVTLSSLKIAAEAGVAAVIGTTGLSQEDHSAIAELACKVPVVCSPNMSVGVNVMLWLLKQAAATLGDSYDVEISEAHHRHKVDSPSGTALKIAEVLCDAKGWEMSEVLRYGRQGQIGPRSDREIGLQVLRGGDVAGDHTVFFLGDGERLEVGHRASSRRVFATGALRAAVWLARKEPGLYGMTDVLDL